MSKANATLGQRLISLLAEGEPQSSHGVYLTLSASENLFNRSYGCAYFIRLTLCCILLVAVGDIKRNSFDWTVEKSENTKMTKFIPLIFFTLTLCGLTFAQSPLPEFEKVKEIKLLESTRDDVRRILGGYDLEDFVIQAFNRFFYERCLH